MRHVRKSNNNNNNNKLQFSIFVQNAVLCALQFSGNEATMITKAGRHAPDVISVPGFSRFIYIFIDLFILFWEAVSLTLSLDVSATAVGFVSYCSLCCSWIGLINHACLPLVNSVFFFFIVVDVVVSSDIDTSLSNKCGSSSRVFSISAELVL